MFQIFSHRGLLQYKENSLEAFQKALEAGCSIEVDVRSTKDGLIVAAHNPDIKGIEIQNASLKQLQRADPSLVLLSDVLDVFNDESDSGAIAAVHLKQSGSENFANIIKNYKRVFVFDTTLEKAEELKKIYPGIKIALSVGEPRLFSRGEYKWRYPTIYTFDEIKDFPYYDAVWGDEWTWGLYSESFVKAFHALGKPVYAISPELHKTTDPAHRIAGSKEKITALWKDLIRWKIDGVCTDYAEECKRVYLSESSFKP